MEKKEPSILQKHGKDAVSKLKKLRDKIENSESHDNLMKTLGDISSIAESTSNNTTDSEALLAASEVQQKTAEAYKKASEVVHENPKFAQIKSLSDFFNTTAENWQNKSKLSKQKLIEQCMREAYDHLGKSEYWESISWLEKALKADPKNAEAWTTKGDAFYGAGNYSEAVSCYDKALTLNPNNPSAQCYKGFSLWWINKLKEAMTSFNNALNINPNMELAHLGKGYTLQDQGKYQEAKTELEAALEINGQSEETLNALCAVCHDGLYDYPRAIEYAKQALKINPNSAPAKANLAEALLSGEDYDRSINLAKQALKTNQETFGYSMRLVTICALYFQNKIESAETATLELLEYFKAINRKQDTNWKFRGLKNTVKTKKSTQDSRLILLSLIELAESDDQTEKTVMARKLIEQLTTPKATQHNLPQEKNLASELKGKIQIKNNATPDSKKPGWYKWEVFLTPQEALSKVANVVYTLHKTFPNRIRQVTERETGFKLQSMGWGEFAIKAEISFIDGTKTTKYHWLKLGYTPIDQEQPK